MGMINLRRGFKVGKELSDHADEALAERIFLIYGFLATAYLRPEGATSDDAGDVRLFGRGGEGQPVKILQRTFVD